MHIRDMTMGQIQEICQKYYTESEIGAFDCEDGCPFLRNGICAVAAYDPFWWPDRVEGW